MGNYVADLHLISASSSGDSLLITISCFSKALKLERAEAGPVFYSAESEGLRLSRALPY